MRSTGKYDIIVSLNIGLYFMKTKIIYISGNEIFDMTDIRAAFNEVRNALNLDKDTVLFGVPIDEDDAGLSNADVKENVSTNDVTPVVNDIDDVVADDIVTESISTPEIIEPVVEKTEKKRSRTKKAIIEPIETPETTHETPTEPDEKIVPILSVLSTNESDDNIQQSESNDDIEIIEDVAQETTMDTEIEPVVDEVIEDAEDIDSDEPDLEKLLSEMKPLNEDILEEQALTESKPAAEDESENIDATLEKLATEFVQTQDKITSNTKSTSRSKIGKLRNILPFKQSKHHDQGLGDLFGWAGVAANDEEFSVPGFFTTASSKK